MKSRDEALPVGLGWSLGLESQLYSLESALKCVGRCEFVSTRVEGLLAFPSWKRFAAWKDLPRRVQKEDLRSSAFACEELSSKKAENDIVVFFRYSYPWVSRP